MSMYPTFEDLDEARVSVIMMRAEFPSGEVVEVNPLGVSREMAPERRMGLLLHVLDVQDEGERQKRLAALWKLWSRDDPGLRQAVSVRFYKDVLSSAPERRHDPPLSHEVLAELRENSPDTSTASPR
ncbi:MAG: hypothetical protein ACJ754_03435 [Pyrinomonadaceae bacterium]